MLTLRLARSPPQTDPYLHTLVCTHAYVCAHTHTQTHTHSLALSFSDGHRANGCAHASSHVNHRRPCARHTEACGNVSGQKPASTGTELETLGITDQDLTFYWSALCEMETSDLSTVKKAVILDTMFNVTLPDIQRRK